MAVHNDYKPVIERIKNSKTKRYELTNSEMKRITGGELPKSMFNRNYIKRKSNELARFIMQEADSFEVVEPKIIINLKQKRGEDVNLKKSTRNKKTCRFFIC